MVFCLYKKIRACLVLTVSPSAEGQLPAAIRRRSGLGSLRLLVTANAAADNFAIVCLQRILASTIAEFAGGQRLLNTTAAGSWDVESLAASLGSGQGTEGVCVGSKELTRAKRFNAALGFRCRVGGNTGLCADDEIGDRFAVLLADIADLDR